MTQNTEDKKSKFPSTDMKNAVFNRKIVHMNRERASHEFQNNTFLLKEITERLIDNLQDIRKTFQNVVSVQADIGAVSNYFKDALVIHQDISLSMIQGNAGLTLQGDEEFFPYQNQSLDLILSCLSLHWVNDVPGALVQFFNSLKPDGLFMAALLGGETLKELRQVMMRAEMELRGGVSPHISPFLDVRDAGSLMQRAGFALPVASAETITVTYANAFSLMKDLKSMAEQNSLTKRFKGLTRPELFTRCAELYHQEYANVDGRIPATFEILYLQGWVPHESQQKPLKPGSATMPLKDALGVKPPKS